MKNKIFVLALIFMVFMLMTFGNFLLESLSIFLMVILIMNYQKVKSHFILLLLILEILSLNILVITSLFISFSESTLMIFLLMTLMVGEAVLGLAILVTLVRWNSKELLTNTLC